MLTRSNRFQKLVPTRFQPVLIGTRWNQFGTSLEPVFGTSIWNQIKPRYNKEIG
jgi:hypothetical protein